MWDLVDFVDFWRYCENMSFRLNFLWIAYLGDRNPNYPLIHEILVGIPSSGDSVQWGFRPVGIPGSIP